MSKRKQCLREKKYRFSTNQEVRHLKRALSDKAYRTVIAIHSNTILTHRMAKRLSYEKGW